MTAPAVTLTAAHWRIAADAVTGQPSEALRVAAVARAIADAEARGAQTPEAGGCGGSASPASGHQPITSFRFETPPSQGEVRARLTAADHAAHSRHDQPHPFCLLCPRVSRNPERAR